MEENLWRREGEIFGMVEGGALEGGFGDGELGGWFSYPGVWGDSRGVYGLVVLLVEVFLCFLCFVLFSRHVKRRIDGTAEAN